MKYSKQTIITFISAFLGGIIGTQLTDSRVSVNDHGSKNNLQITHVDGEPVSRALKIFSLLSPCNAMIEPGSRTIRFSSNKQTEDSMEVSYEFLGGLEYKLSRDDESNPTFIITKT